MRTCCHLVIISKLNHCCEYTTVVNSGILIHQKKIWITTKSLLRIGNMGHYRVD